MKFTLSWLNDYLDADLDSSTVASTLIDLGLEVESIDDPMATYGAFYVAKIMTVAPHPNADKLQLCTVAYGDEQSAVVVCGAPNARPGLLTVFAPEGTYIPAFKDTLKKAKIRGIESAGMLCSAMELGLDTDADGIIELPAVFASRVGESLAMAAKKANHPSLSALGDTVIDLSVTPNRGDCFGVKGIARDVAAGLRARGKNVTFRDDGFLSTLGQVVTLPVTEGGDEGNTFPSPIAVTIDPAAKDACPLFLGRVITGVRNGPSPDWLVDRLKAVGLKPISALVDITNYLSHDQARPLHVFDADKLGSSTLHLRLTQEGETFTALDEITYTLPTGALVITNREHHETPGASSCPEERIHSLAGIMGGLESGCTLETTNVFLEAAYFDPVSIAATAQAIKIPAMIHSDARQRFERGVDPMSALPGLEKATALILALCGGRASTIVSVGGVPGTPSPILFDPDTFSRRVGTDCPREEMQRYLSDLGFEVQTMGPEVAGHNWLITPPSWRHDITGQVDIIEEILRLKGFNTIPSHPLPDNQDTAVLKPGASTQRHQLYDRAIRLLAGRGLMETVTYSFTSKGISDCFGDAGIYVANPITDDHHYLRSTLVGRLCQASGYNLARHRSPLAFFEIGPRFDHALPNRQETALGMLLCPTPGRQSWAPWTRGAWEKNHGDDQGTGFPKGLLDMKSHVEGVLSLFGLKEPNYQLDQTPEKLPAFLHPSRGANLMQGPKRVLGFLGELHPTVAKRMDIKERTFLAEIYLDRLALPKASSIKPCPLSPFQPVERDFAVITNVATPAGLLQQRVQDAVKKCDPDLLQWVDVFDVYGGKGIAPDQKSVGIRIRLQAPDRTLTDEVITTLCAAIVTALEKAGAHLR